MEKEYLLFNAEGACYKIIDTNIFLSNLSDDVLVAYYVLNYYYYLLETANRFLKNIKHTTNVVLMDDDTYKSLENSINLFRKSGRLTDEEIDEMETTTITSFSFSSINSNFSSN